MQILSQPPPDTSEKDGADWPARIRNLMSLTPTAYSLVMMHDDTVYAVRDPFGNRPLSIGIVHPAGGPRGTWTLLLKAIRADIILITWAVTVVTTK